MYKGQLLKMISSNEEIQNARDFLACNNETAFLCLPIYSATLWLQN
jgi:hypothetical protein